MNSKLQQEALACLLNLAAPSTVSPGTDKLNAVSAIGKAGAKNAAYLAVQIMGVSDGVLHQKLLDERADNARAILEKDAALQEKLKSL